jgi:hypothetical protein
VPEEEIPIAFTGVRPGEKLYEELVGTDETLESCGESKINRVCPRWQPDFAQSTTDLNELEWLAEQGRTKAILALLREVIPAFSAFRGGTPQTACDVPLRLVYCGIGFRGSRVTRCPQRRARARRPESLLAM